MCCRGPCSRLSSLAIPATWPFISPSNPRWAATMCQARCLVPGMQGKDKTSSLPSRCSLGREEDRIGFETRQILDLKPCFPLITQVKVFVLSLSFPICRLYSLIHGVNTGIKGDYRCKHPVPRTERGFMSKSCWQLRQPRGVEWGALCCFIPELLCKSFHGESRKEQF